MSGFEQIIGHDGIKKILCGAIRQDQVSHAYLFGGPAGVGKTTLARVFARDLLCLAPGPGGGCGYCRSCRQFKSGNNPDFYHLLPDGNSIKISQVRHLQQKVDLEPYQGKRQVCIIEEAERMTREAANSFLKNLEEPPGTVVFILVTDFPQSLLPTIVSRCQQFNFKPLTGEQVTRGLQEQAGLQEEECRLPAALAGGSLGRALELARGPAPEREELFSLLEKLDSTSAAGICSMSREVVEKNVEWQQFLDMLLMWYRDILVWKNGEQGSSIVNIDKAGDIEAAARNMHVHRLIQNMKAVERAKVKLSSRANTRLVLEELFFVLARV